jgi:ABC-type transport system involved in multi-copper enzyme maturation permease subunit
VPLSRAEIRLNEAVLLILIAFMFSVIMAMGASFLAAPALANDIESGLLLAILPRPIRRAEVVLGKWLGLATPLILYAFVAGGIELATVNAVTGYLPPQPVQAIAYIAAQSLVLLTITLFASTRMAPMASGIIVVVLFGAGWIIGIAQAVGTTFNNHTIANAGTAFSLIFPSDGLWRGAVSALEPAALVAEGVRYDPLAATSSPTAAYLAWAALWALGMLAVAVFSFARREL